MKMIKVLVACEESQTVCKAFRDRGYVSYSCDVQEPSGDHPEWHILGDALKIINGGSIITMDGNIHVIDNWDLLIAHPPCTHLAVSGMRWFKEGVKPLSLKYGAAEFFLKFTEAPIKYIAVENPVSIMSTLYRKPDQIINPWQYGHPEQKKTCLWLKNLPPLNETDNVYDYMMTLPEKERTRILWLGSGHSKERSKTYLGIANAMAEQWGKFVENDINGGI